MKGKYNCMLLVWNANPVVSWLCRKVLTGFQESIGQVNQNILSNVNMGVLEQRNHWALQVALEVTLQVFFSVSHCKCIIQSENICEQLLWLKPLHNDLLYSKLLLIMLLSKQRNIIICCVLLDFVLRSIALQCFDELVYPIASVFLWSKIRAAT